MFTQSKIRNALKTFMTTGEANACNIFKGYDVSTGRTGWHFTRFGSTPTYLGKSETEALATIEDIHQSKIEDR
jgi:hypothetical protein